MRGTARTRQSLLVSVAVLLFVKNIGRKTVHMEANHFIDWSLPYEPYKPIKRRREGMTTAITLENTEIKNLDWSQFFLGMLVGCIATTILWMTIFSRCY